jgi:hypothetical protein
LDRLFDPQTTQDSGRQALALAKPGTDIAEESHLSMPFNELPMTSSNDDLAQIAGAEPAKSTSHRMDRPSQF